MFFRKIGKTAVVCIGFLLDFAHLLNKIFTFEKKIAFFLLTYSDFSYFGCAESTPVRKKK